MSISQTTVLILYVGRARTEVARRKGPGLELRDCGGAGCARLPHGAAGPAIY